MKNISDYIKALMVSFLLLANLLVNAQNPTYSCVAKNDTLISSTVYQFDVYIYQTGSTQLYLNNYQLSFQISNTGGVLNGGAITGSYVSGSTQLPAALTPAGVNSFLSGGKYELRVNGVAPNSNGTLIPVTGTRIGTFRITNTAAFGGSTMNLVWWNTTPATTSVYAIVPPAPTGTPTLITNMAFHTTSLTNPILNYPIDPFNVTGTGSYCTGGPGLAVGLDGSQLGVNYQLILSSLPVGPYVPGTGNPVSFGNQTGGTYTVSAYRAATYLTSTMTGNAVITALPPSPVSISIVASANPVCQATPVTFTATPVNGGTVPAYQWQVNGVNAGTNSTSFTYTPVNNDQVTCILTSNANCPTGNPATSNTVSMTVNPNLPVTVSILASANPVCAGTPVTFTATPTNGGATPGYQWQVNGVNAGTNSASFTYTPVNNDQVTVILTSNATCATGSPATSNTVTITVNPNLPVSVSILASANPVCAGTPVTFTATPTNGGLTPSYQWQVNGVNPGTNNVSFTYTPVNNDQVTVILTSDATCPTGSPATSNTVSMTVNPNLPVSVSVLASANPVCDGSPVTFTATPTNGGATPGYQWKVNGVNAGTNNVSFTYTPVNNDQVTVILTSDATCATGSPATSNTVTMTVNPLLAVRVSILASANPVCAGTPVSFTATPVNGGATPAYQWQVNGVNAGTNSAGFTYTPVNNDQVTVILTSDATCATGSPATSNTVTMTVNPNLPVSVSILASANPVCASTPVTFTATPTNGGPTPGYQWQVNGVNAGTNSASFTYTPVNNDQVTVILTSDATCATGNPATSNTVTMTVNPNLPVSVSILASANPVCAATPVTFTATPTNGGPTPSYQWKVNGANTGTNSVSFTYTPVNNDQVTVVLTSDATCATGSPVTSNTVTMTVNPNLPVSVSILASANPVCASTPVTFTATPTNGGATPGYQWQVNGVNAGTNNVSFTYTPVNNDQVTVILTSDATCATGSPATSNTVTMTVNPNLPVSVSILASANPVCATTPVTFTATPTNGGATPSYQWQVNGVNAGTNSVSFTYTPVNNDQVTVILTSDATCATGSPATSNTITMTVNPGLPVSVSILASANPVCATTPVTFTATPTNGGATPSYQWQVNGVNAGTNSASFTYTPVNNDQVTVILTSDATCATGSPATSNTVTMTVNPILPASVSIVASANPVCASTPVTFTATPTNGGLVPGYQWLVNGVNAGTNSASFTYTPVNNDQVYVVMTTFALCPSVNPATSNTITMTVNPNLPVSVSILASANPVCTGTPVTFTATPTNGGATPGYQWQVNGVNAGTNSASFTYTPVNNDQVTVILTSDATCATGSPATSNTVTMTVNSSLPVSVSILASANSVCAATPVTFTATPTNGGATPSYQWKVNGVNSGTNSASFTYTPVDNDQVTVVLTSSATCATGSPATSNTVTMTVYPILPASVSIVASANPVCAATPVTFTATPTNGGLVPGYQWVVNGVYVGTGSPSFTYTPVNNDQVYVVMTTFALCPSVNPATSNTITMTVTPGLPVSVSILASVNPVCTGTPVTFTATPTNGGATPGYQWQVNGVNAGTNNVSFTYTPVNNDQVTVILTSDATCATGSPATSNTVTMTVNSSLPVSVSILASTNSVCAATPVTFTATPTNGGLTPSYQWKVNGVNSGTNSASFTYTPVNNDQVTVVLTSSETCATGSPATSNTVTMTVNPILPASVSIVASANPVCASTPVTFTATPTNGGLVPGYQWVVNGVYSGTNSASFTYTPVNNDQVYVIMTSFALCPSVNPATSNTITMTVNPNLPVSVSVVSSANPVCASTPVTFTATPTNGGATPSYQWQVNGVNAGTNSNSFTYTPVNNDQVKCILTSSATCATGSPATSNVITMTVSASLPVSVSIVASANPVCAATPVTFTATPTNGGLTPSYQWKVNGVNSGTNSASFTYTPVNNDQVTVVLTSSATCVSGNPATSNVVTMTVSASLPVSVSIVPSANPVCAATPVTFTATPTNGGLTPSYQWKVNGVNAGTNSASFTYTPVNNDQVKVILTSSAACSTGNPATSNIITMTVNPNLPVSVSVVASANPVCASTPVTFTATPTNGGLTPSYQWKVNGVNAGTNSASFTYTPVNNDQVKVILTSSAACSTGNPATSNIITMTVNASLPVSVSILASANPVCASTPVTFTATPVNGGLAPSYQWQVNGVNAGTNSASFTYSPANNDQVKCILTSSLTCSTGNPATSNIITMSISASLPVSVSIVASANPLCTSSPVTFTATPTNGGLAPSYQWQVNGVNAGTNSASYTYSPVNNDQVKCVLTSSVFCATGNPATSNIITMVVGSGIPVTVSIVASANPDCSGFPVTFTATPGNGGTAPAYQWKVNNVNVGTNSPTFTYTPANNDHVKCILTSNSTCATGNPATSNTITMVVNSSPNPTLTGPTTVCQGSNWATYFTQTGKSNYVWNVSAGGTITSGGGTNSFYATVNWNGGGAQWVSVNYSNSNGCSAPNPTVLNVTVNPLPGPAGTISGPTSVCAGGSGFVYSVTPISNATGYFWILPFGAYITNGFNTATITVTFSSIASSGNISVIGFDGCGFGQQSPALAVTVNRIPAKPGEVHGPTNVCQGTTESYSVNPVQYAIDYEWTVPSGASIISGNGTTGITVQFSTSAVSGYITVTAGNSCGTSGVDREYINVNTIPAAPVITYNSGTHVLTSNYTHGNQWFLNGGPLSGATGHTYTVTSSGSYYDEYTNNNGCTSVPSNSINVILSSAPDSVNGITEIPALITFVIYPNPGTGDFEYRIEDSGNETFSIQAFDLTGLEIYDEPNIYVQRMAKGKIDLQSKPDGVYIVKLIGTSTTLTRKLIINK